MTYVLPYLTASIPPMPGTAKADYLDFKVEELPLYLPSGEGSHTYFVLEKQGLTTSQAVREVARELGVPPRQIGVAGQKDSRGITRQMMSVEHRDPDRVAALSLPRIKILNVSRHGNKLKTGHLKGNRFSIKIRDVAAERFPDVELVIDRLTERGVPNFYGPQRFGQRGDTWAIGRALLSAEYEETCRLIAGGPNEHDHGQTLIARELYDQERYIEAAGAWPRGFREAVVVSKMMERYQGDGKRAVFSLDKRMLGFYVSAFQSHLFNQVLAQRIDGLDRVENGDVAYKHENGAAFQVEDADIEQPRADRFEISATGPLFGPKMKETGHDVRSLEERVLFESGTQIGVFPKSGPLRCRGGRRPLRVKLEHPRVEIGEDEHGDFFGFAFSLPAGSYATSVLREVFKDKLLLSDGPSQQL